MTFGGGPPVIDAPIVEAVRNQVEEEIVELPEDPFLHGQVVANTG